MEIHDILQETGIKTILKEKKCKKAKWLAVKRREAKNRRKGKIYPFECRVPNSKER